MRKKATSRMPADERARRREEIGQTASEKIAKSEQLNFRLEEKSIRQLQAMAYQKGIPVGSMVREWVMQRLLQVVLGMDTSSDQALKVLIDMRNSLDGFFKVQDLSKNSNFSVRETPQSDS